MPKFQKKKQFKNKNKTKNKDEPKERSEFRIVKPENKDFYEFYKIQQILSTEELDLLFHTFATQLPTSFRFTGNRSTAVDLRDAMKALYFPKMEKIVISELENEKILPLPTCISWYPNELGWEFDCARSLLRKCPELQEFHRFLISETEVGNISRQETVSMIPVQLLDVQPHHYVLDTCASPGSKTTQIIEALHANGDPLPTGLVIANDADTNRSYTLVKQAKRLQSPALLVTNHEAQYFPTIYYQKESTSGILQFDRILTDVPCCGDGTIRKNSLIWNSWKVGNGFGLHRLQLSILERACALLKIGGRLVYSTCSLNPVENEAVVAEMLRLGNGSFKLVDVSNELPDLKRRPGLVSWKYVTKKFQVFDKYSDVPQELNKNVLPSFFPPENVQSLGLENCLRIYPFLQNSGGFFVAVLEKVGSYGYIDEKLEKIASRHSSEPLLDESDSLLDMNEPESLMENVEVEALLDIDMKENQETMDMKMDMNMDINMDKDMTKDMNKDKEVEGKETPNPKRLKQSSAGKITAWTGYENPFIFLEPSSDLVQEAQQFYGFKNDFPLDCFVVRSDMDINRTIYFVSSAVKRIVMASNSKKLKIVNTGIKVFSRHTSVGIKGDGFQYRMNFEGLQTLAPFLCQDMILKVSLSDMILFLNHQYPKCELFSNECKEQLSKLSMGSYLIAFNPKNEPDYTGNVKIPILLPLWKAAVSASVLLTLQERSSLMIRLTGKQLDFQKGLSKVSTTLGDDLGNTLEESSTTLTTLEE